MKVYAWHFKDLIRPASREGQSVDKVSLMAKRIYLPTDDILTDYYVIENSLTETIVNNNGESARLAEIRDSLLPKLMSGELSIDG
jgi:type I restriction enzyme S subunit